MRKIICPMLAFISGCICLFAQSEENTRPMFGLKAAFDINIPGDWHTPAGSVKMYKHGYGVTVGGVYNVYLGKGFYLEPGVSFFYDSYSCDFTILDYDGAQSDYPSIYKTGIRVPVVAGYAFNITDRFSMSVYTGPELSWAIGGSVKVKDDSFSVDNDIELFGDYQRRVDCAWKFGLGFPCGSFLISLDASVGLTDLLKGDGASFRENRTTVGLTYYF